MFDVTLGRRFFNCTLLDKNDKPITIKLDPYIYGILNTTILKKEHKWHNMILVTGNVGDGKSTLVEGMTAVLEALEGRKISFDNVCWRTEKLIELTDRDDNFNQTIWWDESIQGASGKSMALTSVGDQLKKALVTKRFKRHTYIFVIDEIEEYSKKLIKMCDCWIHVYSKGLTRGKFKAYTDKRKILRLYDLFKIQKATWATKEVGKIKANWGGYFHDYCGIFLDEKEYNKRKLEETKQAEVQDKKSDRELKSLAGMLSKDISQKEIANMWGVEPSYISQLKSKLKKRGDIVDKFPSLLPKL